LITMKKIKVMFIIPSLHIGGSERKVVDLAKHLNKTLFDVLVFCVTEGGELLDELTTNGIKVYIGNKKGKLDLFVITRIMRIIKKEQVDIIHTFVSTSKVWGRIAGILAKTKVIISTEESLYQPSKSLLLLEKLLAKKTDIIICNSYETLTSVQKHTKLPLEKYQVIYNGIDFDKYLDTNIDVKEKRKSLNIDLHDLVVTNIARFDKRKGHKYLVVAFKLFLQYLEQVKPNLSCKLLLVGDGKEQDNIRKLVNELGISNNVIFTGFRQDVNEILKISDIFVLPSLEEGFGNVMIEAFISKVFTIATNIGGIKEIIKHKENGLLVEKGSSEALFNALVYSINHPDKVLEMRERAYQDAERFNIKNIIKRYEDLYIDLYNQKVKK